MKPSKILLANKLLEMALDQSNAHESGNAAQRFLAALLDSGYRRGDLMLIAADTPEHRQLIDMGSQYRAIVEENENIHEKMLELLSRGSIRPLTKRKSPREPVRIRSELSAKQELILMGVAHLDECTIRQLSEWLYNRPDTNEVLADAVDGLMKRDLLARRPILPEDRTKGKSFGSSKWLYYLTDPGTRILKKTAA